MVLCRDCGLFGVRAVTGQLVEATELFRDEAEFRDGSGMLNDQGEEPLVCAAVANNLEDEWENEYSTIRRATIAKFGRQPDDFQESGFSGIATLRVLNNERQCDKFTAWRRGASPKEHLEMLDRQWMIDQQNSQHRWNLGFAGLAIAVSIVSIWIGACINLRAAEIQRDGQPAIVVTPMIQPPPINVIVPTPIPQSVPDTSSGRQ